jgi:arsenate reductase
VYVSTSDCIVCPPRDVPAARRVTSTVVGEEDSRCEDCECAKGVKIHTWYKRDRADLGGARGPCRFMFSRSSLVRRRLLTRACSSGVPTLWHNPDCSKSRACLTLLQERGKQFTIREYLDERPTFAELKTLQKQLAMPPIEWCRTNETAWLDHFNHATIYDDLLPDDDDILRGIEKLPIILERPILSLGTRAVVGRPPERILELLDGTGESQASPEDAARAAAAVEAVSVAASEALDRGVDVSRVERSLLGVVSQLHML